jgi:cysteine-rich repeat protein
MISSRMTVIVGTTLALVSSPSHASVPKASLKCRAAIAAQAKVVIARGLASLDGCHARRDKGKFSGDCNAFSLAKLQGKFAKAVTRACKGGEPALKNYLNGDPSREVIDAVQTALAASGAAVQGDPDLGRVKTKVKCHAAVGRGRSTVVKAIVAAGTHCQKGIDKSGGGLGGLAASCVVTAGNAGSKARGKITRACGTLAGADVGSCDPLPDCVVTSAEETGAALAKAIYGEATVCGNGILERGEECDDGNTTDGDSCTHACKNPVCGDKIVSAGEECDDGNIDNTDACTRVCSGGDTGCVCRLARCGDGFVQAGEECDDGNDTPDDGCTACRIDPTQCQPGAIVAATVAVSYDDISRSLRGFALNLGYPASISIPGHAQDTSVQDRVTDLPGVAFLLTANDSDQNSDGTDDQLRVVYGALSNIPKGDVVKVLFDCETSAVLDASIFSCTVTDTSDPQGDPIPGNNTCSVTLGRP